jgi:hypothetical protein
MHPISPQILLAAETELLPFEVIAPLPATRLTIDRAFQIKFHNQKP